MVLVYLRGKMKKIRLKAKKQGAVTMLDALGAEMKKIMLAGIGAVALTTEKAKDLVDDLVKKGEITVEQGKVLNEELKRNVKAKVREQAAAAADADFVMDTLDHLSDEELAAVKAKIAEKEQKKDEPEQEQHNGTDETDA